MPPQNTTEEGLRTNGHHDHDHADTLSLGPPYRTQADPLSASRKSKAPEVGPVPPYHLHSIEETLTHLDVDPRRGLSASEIEPRRRMYGDNNLSQGKARSALSILLGQMLNPMNLILGAVFVIGIVTEEYIEAVVVVLIILINSGISAVQEIQAERSLNAIRHLGQVRSAVVIRDGEPKTVELKDVVVGDILELQQGQVG
jgi:Ca2+-transporting ATPase